MKHAGPNARRADYTVRRLTRADLPAARALIADLHYAKGVGNTATAVHGLFRRGPREDLVGVAWWAQPGTQRAAAVVPRAYGDPAPDAWRRVLALSRLVVADTEPRNAESILLGAAIADLKRTMPTYDYLVTYADEGEGHLGTIYRASGWDAQGFTVPTDRWLDADGRHVAQKARTTRTVGQMLAAGYIRTGKTRKARFTMALKRKRTRRNPTPEVQAQIDAEVAAGLYDDPLKGDPTWERFCEVEERLVGLRPGSKGYATLAREYTALRAKLKASRPARGPRRNPRFLLPFDVTAAGMGDTPWGAPIIKAISAQKQFASTGKIGSVRGYWITTGPAMGAKILEFARAAGVAPAVLAVVESQVPKAHRASWAPGATPGLNRENPALLEIGQRVKHPTYGPGTVVAPYSGPFGPSWLVEFDDGKELAIRPRDVVPLIEPKRRNPGFRYTLTPPTPPPLAQEQRVARARLLGKVRRNGPAASKLQALIKADEDLAARLLAIADPQYVGQVISGPASIAEVVRPFVAGYDQELLAVIAVNRRHAVIGGAVLTKGNDSFTIVDPKMIYRWALTQGRSGASAIVMVHNHPSGDPRPSQADIDVTQRVAQAGKVLGITLLDHIVMTDSGAYTSLAERGQVPYGGGGTLTMTGG